jgi:alpha-tubulin suppressor-like RCC1 family protein
VLAPTTSEARRGPAHQRIVTGNASCAVVGNGTVRCWGYGGAGELGNGGTADSTVPVTVTGLTDVVALSSWGSEMFALRSNGTVWRWGKEYAAAPTLTPVAVPGMSDVVTLAVSRKCGIRVNGRVVCWEGGVVTELAGVANAVTMDQNLILLANGTVGWWVDDHFEPFPGISSAVAIGVAGANFAVLADGTIRSWGTNVAGLLGTGQDMGELWSSETPVTVIGIDDAVAVTGADHPGGGFACALLDDGDVRCWGSSAAGLVGDDGVEPTHSTTTPVPVPALDGVVQVSGEPMSACALRVDGTARCWGDNSSGQLGDGTTTPSATPVPVVGLTGANEGPKVATGMYHGCGLRSDGTVKCWGDNSQGQIGDGTQVDRTSATLVAGLSNVVDVAAGGKHSCALLDDTTVRCWGRNTLGELGDDSASGARSTTPVTVYALDIVTQLAAGDGSTCALRSDGTVACWGSNAYGQLGDGTNTSSDVPVLVSGLNDAVAIDGMRFHYCALRSGGSVMCWGSNLSGQLGNGSSGAGAHSNVPVTVRSSTLLHPTLFNVVSIAAGNNHGCATLASGAARCWGLGTGGALGHGAWTNSSYAVSVSSLTNAVDVAAGGGSSCALRSNGSVRCWGDNDHGELGNGDDTATNVPVSVGMSPLWLGNAIDIDSGYDHACVAKSNGSIWCWGSNNNGQLGNGSNFDSELPVGVAAFP